MPVEWSGGLAVPANETIHLLAIPRGESPRFDTRSLVFEESGSFGVEDGLAVAATWDGHGIVYATLGWEGWYTHVIPCGPGSPPGCHGDGYKRSIVLRMNIPWIDGGTRVYGIAGAAFDGAGLSWHEGTLYLFGGANEDGTIQDSVLAVVENRTEVLGRLPSPLRDPAVAWVNGVAYLLFAEEAGNRSTAVVRFDPATGASATMKGRLPSDFDYDGASIASDNRSIVVFGARPDAHPERGSILRFDPVADRWATLHVAFPHPLANATVAWAGDAFHIFGGDPDGEGPKTGSDEVWRLAT